MNWYNDGEYKCNDCETVFKVYYKNDEGEVNFCSNCNSRDIEPMDDETEV